MNKLILLLGLIVALGFNPVSAQQAYNCPFGGGMMYGSYGGVGIFFGWLFYLLLIALIIAAIYWLIKSATKKK